MRKPEPSPRGFIVSAFYEQAAAIMRNDARRFFLFSPQMKLCLSIYLDLKERHQQRRRAA